MTTEWAHLPNAVHIDRVNASVLANPDHWYVRSGSQAVVRRGAADAGWAAIRAIQIEPGKYAAREEAWQVTRKTQVPGRERSHELLFAILALCVYDDCAYMLDAEPSDLAILAALGDRRAVLLLGACKILHSLKELA